ncbi:PREDICTED: blue copper protein-like [Populus euphratica]|uniref:Blue copper protein-like n=1 Tax=Populus euphratica TaxID=75702 RepID=A0AAJ6XM00_POPEU|nr:PREDICTED: blue copper protein-like [Populus euphratica]
MDYVKKNIQIRKSVSLKNPDYIRTINTGYLRRFISQIHSSKPKNSLSVLSLYAPAFLQPIFIVFRAIMANLRKTILAVSFLATALCGVSMATVYQVGDSAGWTSMGQVDYQDWAANKNFHGGDSLVFNYNNQFHNVKQVTHQDFESCNATSPIATYTNGSDTVTLEKLGHFYFICGYPGHCQAGQKIDILVTPATSKLSPAPLSQISPSSASTLSSSNLSWASGVLLAICLSGFCY